MISTQPPELGAACRDLWLLKWERTYLNHGSFGAAPKPVLARQSLWRERMESDLFGFIAQVLPKATRDAASILAAFAGAKGPDLAFVDNATTGCNAVLNSLSLKPGDEILVTNHGYGAVHKAARHVAERAGARVAVADIPFPLSGEDEIIERVRSCLGPQTRLAVFDHVTSPTAAVFPVRELTAHCHEAGVKVLIDGAHAPGMLTLDIPAIGADWYVGNCHKWLMAPKGAGFLWAAPDAQAHLHPTAISHGYGEGFLAEFDWTGTRDPSAFLSVPDAIHFHEALGGMALRRRNRALVLEAADFLARSWGTAIGAPAALTGSMSTIRLPLDRKGDQAEADKLRHELYTHHRIDVQTLPFSGALWARISAQAYNEFRDYERLAEIIGKF